MSWLSKYRDLGVFLLRLFVGFRLVYGVADNIVSWGRMKEFASFLSKVGFPVPLLCAMLSVYAQFVAGAMIVIGWRIRYAALAMVINFTVAWWMVDRHRSVEEMTPALAMLFCSIFFLFNGSGRVAVTGD